MSEPRTPEPAANYQCLVPYLYYADATEALEWLVRVFGFTEKVRYVDSAGEVFQAVVVAGSSEIHLAGVGTDYWPAKGVDGPVGQLNIVYVDDVEAQYHLVSERLGHVEEIPPPQQQPYGAKVFTVRDVGGNSWTFWQRTTDEVTLPSGWREIRADA